MPKEDAADGQPLTADPRYRPQVATAGYGARVRRRGRMDEAVQPGRARNRGVRSAAAGGEEATGGHSASCVSASPTFRNHAPPHRRHGSGIRTSASVNSCPHLLHLHFQKSAIVVLTRGSRAAPSGCVPRPRAKGRLDSLPTRALWGVDPPFDVPLHLRAPFLQFKLELAAASLCPQLLLAKHANYILERRHAREP